MEVGSGVYSALGMGLAPPGSESGQLVKWCGTLCSPCPTPGDRPPAGLSASLETFQDTPVLNGQNLAQHQGPRNYWLPGTPGSQARSPRGVSKDERVSINSLVPPPPACSVTGAQVILQEAEARGCQSPLTHEPGREDTCCCSSAADHVTRGGPRRLWQL